MKDEPLKYERRKPEETVLYKVISENLDTFIDMVNSEQNRNGLTKYVEKELRAFLECGIHAHGVCLVRCMGEDKTEACNQDVALPFSCKFRGFCPSCSQRRMYAKSIFLSEQVLPKVNMRQWVLSVPIELRYWMASDDKILKKVNQIAVREISKLLRKKIGRKDFDKIECGLISFIQRSSSDLALNYHFHILALDGVYLWNGDSRVKPKFRRISQLTDKEVEEVVVRIRDRSLKYLVEIGKLSCDGGEFAFSDCDEELDEHGRIKIAAVRRRIALGERAGERVREIGRSFGKTGEQVQITGERTAYINGFSLHANRRVKAGNREELEFLIRYISRGELSEDSLSLDENSDVILTLKRPFSNGTTAIKFSPLELIEKISSIIPYPYKNLIIYSGCFAPHSKMRSLIVPKRDESVESNENKSNYYIPWAELLRRVFCEDLFTCPHCGGQREIVAVVTKADILRKILKHLNLPPYPPNHSKSSLSQYGDFEYF
jgi:hypothetical protein